MLTSVAAAAVSTVDGNKAPELFALVVISAVEIFSALLHPVWSLYAVLLGAVSFAIGSLMLLWNTYHVRSLDGACCRLPKVGDITAGFLLAIFLLLWWAAGAGIVTFDGPFTTTSNGYFAAWAGLACSVLLLVLRARQRRVLGRDYPRRGRHDEQDGGERRLRGRYAVALHGRREAGHPCG